MRKTGTPGFSGYGKACIALCLLLVFSPRVCSREELSAQRKALVLDSLRTSVGIGGCCGGSTLEQCKANHPDCDLVERLNAFAANLNERTRGGEEQLVAAFHRRVETLTRANPPVVIDTAGWPVIGKPGSPVVIVEYFSATCPLCKTVYLGLHREVTEGDLKGKAVLVSKPFGSGVGDLALMAAHAEGVFAPLKLALSQDKRRLSLEQVLEKADSLGIDRGVFEDLTATTNAAARARIEASRKEADALGVTHTPTLFIDAHRYTSTLSVEWIVDAVQSRYGHREVAGRER